MKPAFRKIPVLFFMIVLLAGCVDIDVKTSIHPDGSGKQVWKFTTTALLASRLKNQIERNPLFTDNKAKLTEQFKEGDYILEADIEFENVSNLHDRFREMQLEKRGIFRRTYTYTETWKRDFDQNGFVPEQAAGLVPITVKLAVELPGKVIDSNAQIVEGSTAQWSLPLSELVKAKTFRVVSRRWNFVVLVPVLLLLVAALAAGVLLILSTVRKSGVIMPAVSTGTAPVRCASCQSSVPSGSIFCNVCGTRLNQRS